MIIFQLIASYFLFYSIHWLIHIVQGLHTKRLRKNTEENIPSVLVVLPAYKPTPIFFKVIKRLQNAISGKPVQVYCLMQEADRKYIIAAKKAGFVTKSRRFSHLPGNPYHRALNFIADYVDTLQDRPDYTLILDKDNLMDKDFLNAIGAYQDYDIIQGKRCAIHTEGDVALFDHISERLNDIMYRSAKANLGLVPEISGSGALIRTELFQSAIRSLDPKAPGYDQNFMVQVLNQEKLCKVAFVPEMKVYEEKTDDPTVFKNQRIRWFGEQYYNAIFSAKALLNQFFTKRRIASIDYLITLWRPPRSLHWIIVALLGAIELGFYIFRADWPLGWPFFTAASIATFGAILIFLLHERILTRVLSRISVVFHLAGSNLFSSAVSIKKENQGKFIHTDHKL